MPRKTQMHGIKPEDAADRIGIINRFQFEPKVANTLSGAAMRLRKATGEGVSFYVLDNGERINYQSSELIKVDYTMLQENSIYDYPSGKILAAFCSDEERMQILSRHGYPQEHWNGASNAAEFSEEHHKGTIVFIGSNTAYRAIPNRSAYCASKGGINAMSKAFAIDLGPYGIRSNVVLPGTIKTQRWVEMGSKQIVNGELTPIGDISDFEDIANAAWYLESDESKNVTGTEITVDGGMSYTGCILRF